MTKKKNNAQNPTNNAAAGYQVPVKIELFEGCRSTEEETETINKRCRKKEVLTPTQLYSHTHPLVWSRGTMSIYTIFRLPEPFGLVIAYCCDGAYINRSSNNNGLLEVKYKYMILRQFSGHPLLFWILLI